MNRLAVVVLNFNGAEWMEACLNSLAKLDFKDFQIVVIDNNSADNSRQLLEKAKGRLKEKLHVIYNHKNSGFAGGVNIGIGYALKGGFDGVALFNNDAIADKNWLKNLSQTLNANPKAGIATGLLLHEDGKTIDSTGDWYSKWGLPFPRGRDMLANKAPTSGKVFGASGGATLYRSELFKDIGLFDERFFAYYEDVDISFRAQLAGWEVFYNAKAIAYHKEGETSKRIPGFRVYQTFKNLPLIYFKNIPRELLLSVGLRLWLAYTLIFLNAIRKGAFWYAFKGWLASLGLVPHAIKQRFYIQRNKKVEVLYIKSVLWPDLPPEQTGLRKLRKFFTRSNF